MIANKLYAAIDQSIQEVQKTYLQAEDIDFRRLQNNLQDDVDSTRITIFDPDFLALAFPVAIALDIAAIVGALLYITGIIPLVVTIISIFVGIFVTLWMWYRTGRMENAIQRAHEILEQAAMGSSKAKKGMRALRVVSLFRNSKLLRKILFRYSLGVVANILPFLGLIPFWTIFVFLTMRETNSRSENWLKKEI